MRNLPGYRCIYLTGLAGPIATVFFFARSWDFHFSDFRFTGRAIPGLWARHWNKGVHYL